MSGLCVTCAKALETENLPTTLAVEKAPPVTEFQLVDHGSETITGSFDVQADTQLWDGKIRHRKMPAGYELIRHLGAGGMGDVYLVRELASDRTLAIKFLREAGDPPSVDRFIREVKSLGALDHPNIVRVITPDLNRADPFFTMEHASGGTLSDRVKADGPMEPEAAARLMVCLARAVSAAHGKEILHRDIKPGNILYAADDTPKLSDFGLAKRLDDQSTAQTQASRAVGTPPFMPPEAVSRQYGEFSAASDVYGLGATLYFILTGRTPFSGEYHEVMSRVVKEEPPRPRSIDGKIPLGLEAIVLKCLAKNPSDRYTSAEVLAADLETFLAGGKPTPPPRTRLRRVLKWAGRHAARIAASVAVVAAIGFAVWAWSGLDSPAKSDADPHDDGEWIQSGLQRGPLTLIGETGLPKYYRFPLEAVTLGPSTTGDKTCYYHAFHQGLVELSPPPGIDAYRIELELQHVLGRGNGADYLGFYFGFCSAEADGATAHSMFAATFAEHLPIANAKLQNAGLSPVYFRRLGWVKNPQGQTLDASIKSDRYATFSPNKGTPGPWRKFQADISPDEVHIVWIPEPGKPETLVRLSGEVMRREHEELRKKLAGHAPAAAAKLPAWSSDLAFGTISVQAAIAIKNVKIIPRPKNSV